MHQTIPDSSSHRYPDRLFLQAQTSTKKVSNRNTRGQIRRYSTISIASHTANFSTRLTTTPLHYMSRRGKFRPTLRSYSSSPSIVSLAECRHESHLHCLLRMRDRKT